MMTSGCTDTDRKRHSVFGDFKPIWGEKFTETLRIAIKDQNDLISEALSWRVV